MRRVLNIFVLLILCLGIYVPVAADSGDKEFPDLERENCSITVNFSYKEEGEDPIPVEDGRFAIYRLAKAIVVTEVSDEEETGFKYEMISDIGDYSAGYHLKEDGSDFEALLTAFNGLEDKPKDTELANSGGQVKFDNLPLGVYVVYQVEPFAEYKDIRPFLITIPFYVDAETHGDPMVAVYDVVADAKMEPIENLKPITADPPVTKKVDGTGAPDVEFEFHFERLAEDYPMPEGHDGYEIDDNTIGTKAKNGETKEFGDITFTKPGVYRYQVTEVKGTEANFTYDDSVYVYEYEIVKNEDELAFAGCRVYKNGDLIMETEPGVSPDEVDFGGTFENSYKKQSQPEIPFTGQHWWPMYLLIASGMILTVLGIYRRRQVK